MRNITIHQELELRATELEVSKYTHEQLVTTVLLLKRAEMFMKELIKTLMIGELEARHDAEHDMYDSNEMAEWGIDCSETSYE